jgi:glutathione S-transferase
MAASLYTTDLRLFYPDQFTNDQNGHEGVMASGRADMDRFFGILNDALESGPYLLGQTFSAADIYLWMLAGWHPDPEKLMEINPRIKKLVDLVQARPSATRVWTEHN